MKTKMKIPRFSGASRRGQAMVMVALLMPVLIGVLGLCLDAGVFAVARAHLVTVADAAALAGAAKLSNPARMSVGYSMTNDINAAQSQALAIGRVNKVLGQNAVMNSNATNDPSGDVVVGYINTAVPGSPLVTTSTSSSLFNSVQVNAQRTADRGGAVPAFFSSMLGFGPTPITAQSTATVQNHAVSGFKCSPTGKRTKLVPIGLSQTTYNAMIGKLTTDNYTANASTGTVTSGADGLYESSLYPVSSGSGNWGTIGVGVNNGTAALSDQIQHGVTTDDISASFGCSMKLNPTITAPGNPGVSLGMKPALMSLIGKTVIVPVYNPAATTGNGSNLQYSIVNFAPVVVLDATFNGNHSTLIVQPSLVTDPTAVPGPTQSSWSSGGLIRLHLSR